MKSKILSLIFVALLAGRVSAQNTTTTALTPAGPTKAHMTYDDYPGTQYQYFVFNSTVPAGAPDAAKVNMQDVDVAHAKQMMSQNKGDVKQFEQFYQMMQSGASVQDLLNVLGMTGYELVTVTSYFDADKNLKYTYYLKKKLEKEKQQ